MVVDVKALPLSTDMGDAAITLERAVKIAESGEARATKVGVIRALDSAASDWLQQANRLLRR